MALADMTQHLARLKEGGQEFVNTLPLLSRFLDDADRLARFMRQRSLAQRYDNWPVDLALFDRSRLLASFEKGVSRPWLTSKTR